ncbi:putative peptide ABC transporter ATP-binding protein [Microlunatus phosphovorus NM-1]|uniref:Putative peptide ABC transporter ATP-binding protein n=1 Tax=Microlunatus phosphovorus (strain ATCC 700054 / DSM 10555 / JCM 9379 / NBRC 101784 / NCIMB 13414 / VKM Ac-1990 / NM-1) TaxID=1032480 RepID=F5XNY1_MICPN|nr:ABC transporter ATP-binding protein [Microlunatus phosphovorus]BAK36621.1 putative peptide ABC transporter ATP-binding protein [Microlunatus phosphovorus NM-1]
MTGFDTTLTRGRPRPRANREENLLEVDNLSVTFARKGSRPVRAVDGVSFEVRPGQIVGIVGESGSGKSVTSLAVMGLLPPRGVQTDGQIRYRGQQLLGASTAELNRLRGREIAMVFQDPMSSLNPVIPIGLQVTEVLVRHSDVSRSEARVEAEDLLRRCGIPDPGRRLKEYPHQLSGGMRQRALIAIALACKPALLICDEPTTALDVTIQAQVLELLKELVNDLDTAMIMITHDLGVVAGLCDVVNVMYSGRIVESANRRELFAHPRHRYTEGLLASIPRLDSPPGEPLRPIRGTPRDVIAWSKACAFAPRCDHADEQCATADLPLLADGPGDHLIRCVHPAPAEGDPGADGPDKGGAGRGGVVDV